METLSNKSSNTKKPQDELDIKKMLSIYLKQWKWFVLSCMIFIGLGFFYLRYTTPKYNAYAKIMLMENDGITNPADALLKDLGEISNTDKIAIEDEIEVFKSRKLMTGVVKKLNLNKQFYLKGRLHDTQLFPNEKAPVKINFLASDSIIYKSNFTFSLRITSETTFDFIYKPRSQKEEISKKMFFGKNVPTPVGDIIVTPNVEKISNLANQVVYVQLKSLDRVAESFKSSIRISQAADLSKVLNLSLKDPSVPKAKAVINTLIEEYNRVSIEDKSNKSNNTAEFINKRINLIATDLSEVDDEIEQFKTGNKLTDITSEADLYLNSNAQTERNLAASRTQYSMINYMKNQISDDSFERIPSNVGLKDGSINLIAKKYNDLLDERDKLLKSSSEKNPIIVNLDQQLGNLKNNLRQSLNSTSKAISIQISSLENRSAKINSKIYAVPGQVRKSRDIQREQGIKESLYLYLLQKREEATISMISTSPNAKVIDEAHSNYTQVSPKKTMTYLASMMIGLLIPFGVIYIRDLLDNKIHNKEDLEKEIRNITVLGEIPNAKGNDKNLIERNDRSILSESFRIIRTNFDYVKRGREVDNYENVIFVTSTINGEGKSFFSLNMALTLANTGKRVLLLGADIRNPQIYSAIKNKKGKDHSKVGLTEFIVDKSIIVGETINTYDINGINIDILLSGKVPPNPAELLMSDRIKDLFDSVSDQYDYVIVDTAPSMLVTDTLLMSQYAGHTIYLTRADYTEKRILNFAKELHAEKKLNGMMLVVNDVKQSNFGYGAKYGYYGAPQKKGFFRRKA
ncbi:GumC family protein [Flavivirga spongiicola]|uniref:non-specific protein-tyrosine kinase n=1 Tax=Flavivirga spongiicola TaxID=421621 RepID=A0ABU7XXI0_9FLAO|nr:tyrosine-protein kinase family protein [Flavivirga sp. MEBiC05379]MDO5980499.1 polysaccharide biosynthesis tyrosine autokinase [Flavivirga sp. MEBiC05379]